MKTLTKIALTGAISLGSVFGLRHLENLSNPRTVENFTVREFPNHTEVMRINGHLLNREYWIDKGNNGTVDEHYRVLDSLKPYLFGLRRLPLKVEEKDQELYAGLRR